MQPRLASTDLPALLMSSKTSSTPAKYQSSWRKWKNWLSTTSGVAAFPVDPFHFSLFIADLVKTGHKSVADSVTAAVKWVHSLAALLSPTDNSMVKIALQAFKRTASSTPIRKEPITSETLLKFYAAHGHPQASLADLRILFVCY